MNKFQQIMNVVNKDLNHLNSQISPRTLKINVREGLEEEFPNNRDYAYTYVDDNGEYNIVFSTKMYNANLSRIRAVMRHEMGHALFFLMGNEDHSEIETDNIAEQIWGERLYYDDEDIQTLNFGKHPRPEYLHQ
jgi:hypothetical protein